MKNTLYLKWTALTPVALALLCGPFGQALRADCVGSPYPFRTSIVTYFASPDQPASSTDPRCTLVNRGGVTVCQIRLMGILHEPLTFRTQPTQFRTRFPAIVYSHGSGKVFEVEHNTCELANYFVPKDYVFFFPFRRGNGLPKTSTADPDDLDPNRSSTGRNIIETKQAYRNTPFSFNTPCNTNLIVNGLDDATQCFAAQLLKEESADVALAFDWLKQQGNVDNNAMALMGNSYGGIMSVLTNAMDLGQQAAVPFSAGGESWKLARVSAMLLDAAKSAKKPAFYLQARWDYDTRPTVELAYSHANAAPEPKHGKPFMASIFSYKTPPIDPSTGEPSEADMQNIHTSFAKDSDVWGPAVLDFLQRHGVK